MPTIKKRQCPHCTHNSSRRWNLEVHIKRKHAGIGKPFENGNLSQRINSVFPSGIGKPAGDMKPPNSYNGYNRLYTNHVSKSSKGNEDIIDKMYPFITQWEEKEHKINKIMEFRRRYPDAPMQTPNVDSSNFPIKNMLDQCLPKISFQNKPSNIPSHHMQGYNNRNRDAGQKTRTNSIPDSFPSHDRGSDPKSIQPVPVNYDDDNKGENHHDRSGLPKNRWVVKRNMIGDWVDFYRIVDDPVQDVLDTHELNWKKGG